MRGPATKSGANGESDRDGARLFDRRRSVKPVQFLLTDELKEQIRARAYEERRSMSEIAREALQQYLAQP